MAEPIGRRALLGGVQSAFAPVPEPGAGARAFAARQEIQAVVPDRLYRVGCVVKGERLSWLPQDIDGYEPLNAYLLMDDNDSVFMEMGSPVMLPAIQDALAKVGSRKPWLWFSRNEADCIGNMGYLLAKANKPTLLFGSIAGGIFEWINDPAVSITDVRDFQGRSAAVPSRNGAVKRIGNLEFDFMDAGSKQMYMTQWVFERTTGTLFTSDSFGFRHLSDLNASNIVEGTSGLPAVATVAREIVEKFNWMREAEFPDVIERFEKIFKDHDVQVIAPVHGCVIKGRDAVAAHVRLAVDAMHAASKLPDTERLYYV